MTKKERKLLEEMMNEENERMDVCMKHKKDAIERGDRVEAEEWELYYNRRLHAWSALFRFMEACEK